MFFVLFVLKLSVIRSLTHPYPLHGVAFALTGVPAIDVPMELSPRDARHHPFFGSVVEYVESQKLGATAGLSSSVPSTDRHLSE